MKRKILWKYQDEDADSGTQEKSDVPLLSFATMGSCAVLNVTLFIPGVSGTLGVLGLSLTSLGY